MSAADSDQPGSSTERDPVDLLAEAFLRRRRAGEALEVEAFAAEHPDHQEALCGLLPTLLLLERVKRQEESTAGGLGRPRVGRLQRLGDFRIEREIGRGGMGVVFEAVQEPLDRRVALKVLPQSHLLTGHQLERFRREAQTAARLHHSHIVPVFGCGEADGYQYYAMQFIDGHGLDRWIAERREAPPAGAALQQHCRAVARFGIDVAQALHYAHGQGTLHRDVKPSNLLLDRDGQVWVTDFGLAKALEQDGLTVSGDLLGTLQYMAPEQLRGLYDERSEVYALGLSLYEMLALQPAFVGRTRSELIDRIQNGSPERLGRLQPQLPADLATIVERACAREPADRYASADQLAQDLDRFLHDRPILARRHSAAELLWRWCRRHRALATLSGVAAAAVLLLAIGGWIAFGITRDALQQAKDSAGAEKQAHTLAQTNLGMALEVLEKVFDTYGPDPFHGFEEDPDTGEYGSVLRSAIDPRAATLMQSMLEFYDRFAATNADDVRVREQTARAHRRVGEIRYRLGQLDLAEQAFGSALRLYQDLHTQDAQLQVAGVLLDLARTVLAAGDTDAADQRCREALRTLEAAPGSRRQQFAQAQAHVLMLWIVFDRLPPDPFERFERFDRPDRRGRGPMWRWLPDLQEHQLAASQLLDELQQDDADNPELLELRARLLRFQGRPRRSKLAGDDVDEAAARAQAVAILDGLVQRFPAVDRYRFELVDTLRLQADPRPLPGSSAAGREQAVAQAAGSLQKALLQARELVAQQPEIPAYRDQLLVVQEELGRCLLRLGLRAAGDAEARPLLAGAAEHLAPALQRARQQAASWSKDRPQTAPEHRRQSEHAQWLRLALALALHGLDRDDPRVRVLLAECLVVHGETAGTNPGRGRRRGLGLLLWWGGDLPPAGQPPNAQPPAGQSPNGQVAEPPLEVQRVLQMLREVDLGGALRQRQDNLRRMLEEGPGEAPGRPPERR